MSFLTPSTCLALGETLIEISRIETQVEVIRKMLCEQPRFHPYLAFKMIDTINQEKKVFYHFDLEGLFNRLRCEGLSRTQRILS